MKKILYCDFDGIITQSKKRLIELYNLYYKPLDSHIINYKEAITWDCGIPLALVEKIFKRKDFFSINLEMHEGVIDGFKMLKNRDYEIILYSKGSLKNLGYKIQWCDKNLGDYLDGWILSGSNELKMVKNQVDMFIDSSEGFSVLIDDCYTNLCCDRNYKWKHHMPTYSICGKLSDSKDEEWNKEWNGLTIFNWNELSSVLDKIEAYENNVVR